MKLIYDSFAIYCSCLYICKSYYILYLVFFAVNRFSCRSKKSQWVQVSPPDGQTAGSCPRPLRTSRFVVPTLPLCTRLQGLWSTLYHVYNSLVFAILSKQVYPGNCKKRMMYRWWKWLLRARSGRWERPGRGMKSAIALALEIARMVLKRDLDLLSGLNWDDGFSYIWFYSLWLLLFYVFFMLYN